MTVTYRIFLYSCKFIGNFKNENLSRRKSNKGLKKDKQRDDKVASNWASHKHSVKYMLLLVPQMRRLRLGAVNLSRVTGLLNGAAGTRSPVPLPRALWTLGYHTSINGRHGRKG